jgi:hypothetical protein
MKRIALLCAVLSFAALPALHAQTLVTGTWTGFIIPPNSESNDVTYEVTSAMDTLKITLVVPGMSSFPFVRIRFEEKTLVFDWEPGTVVHCKLEPTDERGYKGECVDDSGESGTMVMVPPKT